MPASSGAHGKSNTRSSGAGGGRKKRRRGHRPASSYISAKDTPDGGGPKGSGKRERPLAVAVLDAHVKESGSVTGTPRSAASATPRSVISESGTHTASDVRSVEGDEFMDVADEVDVPLLAMWQPGTRAWWPTDNHTTWFPIKVSSINSSLSDADMQTTALALLNEEPCPSHIPNVIATIHFEREGKEVHCTSFLSKPEESVESPRGQKGTSHLASGELKIDVDKSGRMVGDKASQPLLRNPEWLEETEDLIQLSYLHDAGILNTIRTRYVRHRQIYTYSGIVLVAVNPFTRLNIYGTDFIQKYVNQPFRSQKPHVYAVAEEAYRCMVREDRDQSIVVSGESGAGKTMSANFVLRYLVAVDHATKVNLSSKTTNKGGKKSSGNQALGDVEQQIIATSTIMESFGNARTLRNDNSSRFGKYMEIQFDHARMMIGANIKTYLLERSRVVQHSKGERNYHIFYQLTAGAQAAERRTYNIQTWKDHNYLNMGKHGLVKGIDDAADFATTQKALSLLGVSVQTQWEVFKVLNAILWLGDLTFEGKRKGHDEEARVMVMPGAADQPLDTVSHILGVKANDLSKLLTTRTIVARGERITKNLSVGDAAAARDTIGNFLYNCVFTWVVRTLNDGLSEQKGICSRFIGILDIYGFECFDVNSFEQFCINYANEKLQQEFTRHIFKLEQDEYAAEGIPWVTIDFYDNQACVDLIEGTGHLLDSLDEQSRIAGGSDANLLLKWYKTYQAEGRESHTNRPSRSRSLKAGEVPRRGVSPGGRTAGSDHMRKTASETMQELENSNLRPEAQFFSKPRFSQTAFTIRHFAYEVTYEVSGFMSKNTESITPEQISGLATSSNPFFHSLVEVELEKQRALEEAQKEAEAMASTRPGRSSAKKLVKKETLSAVFKKSLGDLMGRIKMTSPNYIRCIKPNEGKAAFSIQDAFVLNQLRACGLSETIRISAKGFPSKYRYETFMDRYWPVAEFRVNRNDVSQAKRVVVELAHQCFGSDRQNVEYAFGKTKIFLKAGLIGDIERQRTIAIDERVTLIQTCWRRFVAQRAYRELRKAAITLQAYWRGLAARKLRVWLRQTRAATRLQAAYRCHRATVAYTRMRLAALQVQAVFRLYRHRRREHHRLQVESATKIQAAWRSYAARAAFVAHRRKVVVLQCLWRQKRARAELRQLKIESRSVKKFEEKTANLERKIVSLTQSLIDARKDNTALAEEAKSAQKAAATSSERVAVLEAELHSLRATTAAQAKELRSLHTSVTSLEEKRRHDAEASTRKVEALKSDLERRSDDLAIARQTVEDERAKRQKHEREARKAIEALQKRTIDLQSSLAAVKQENEEMVVQLQNSGMMPGTRLQRDRSAVESTASGPTMGKVASSAFAGLSAGRPHSGIGDQVENLRGTAGIAAGASASGHSPPQRFADIAADRQSQAGRTSEASSQVGAGNGPQSLVSLGTESLAKGTRGSAPLLKRMAGSMTLLNWKLKAMEAHQSPALAMLRDTSDGAAAGAGQGQVDDKGNSTVRAATDIPGRTNPLTPLGKENFSTAANATIEPPSTPLSSTKTAAATNGLSPGGSSVISAGGSGLLGALSAGPRIVTRRLDMYDLTTPKKK
eukprot:Clim_evm26s144 gene=Clim_evmTU26s144